ncbi:MAG: C40 family peptidase [Candidatus Sumerlaeaceae bacterium]|nr:C40 family peptidase [Candidatus Sumerlaeaceae bacterium]
MLNAYRRLLTDTTFFYLRTQISRAGNGWRLDIRTNAREIGECAAGILRTLGCTPLDLNLLILPNRDSLGNQLFGVTLQTAALTWGEPQEGKDVQTQLLPCEPVWLLDCTTDKLFYLVHGSDGYVGWVRADAIAPLSEVHLNALLSARAAMLVAPWTDGLRALSPGTRLPLSNRQQPPTASDQSLSKEIAVTFPRRQATGVEFEPLTIPRALLNLVPELRQGQTAVEAALTLYGTPYVFGGRSANGLDCSGLVGASYEAAGLRLPRDARQMVIVGRLVATRWHRKTLLPGDILFFIDKTGKVIHTGLSLGAERFIHSSPPCVQVNSFSPDDPLYSKTWTEAFIFARRPLD